ncbi:hypothetical protein [Aureivirga marina]|uniref:hypothetical protein n=1 Tax=Aureivirga marina TaxID=1182451 RepID=UPI0018C9DA41|nr:hypothetical protein [Aureivirga marina]
MKQKITLILFLIASFSGFSQDYMKEITNETCKCIENLDEEVSREKLTMELGLCMMQNALKYKAELEKDYGIDLTGASNLEKEGEKLGQVIAIELMSSCPKAVELFTKLAASELEEEAIASEAAVENSILETSGKVLKVEKGSFIYYTVKEDNGKTSKFYWLTFVENDLDLESNEKNILKKNVIITYEKVELFDPRIKEYKEFNVINSVSLK